jgi:uncharacterized protein (TIGR03435 family)
MMIRAVILSLVTFLAINAQTPQFEVVSIKVAPPPDGRGMRVSSQGGPGSKDPGLYTCENCQISGIIQDAYKLQSYQFSGQSWMDEARFMISAKVPEGATHDQFRQMLQNMLLERFKLTSHHEKKEMAAFDLVVARNGPKIKEAKPGEEPEPAKFGPMKKDENGYPILPASRQPMMMAVKGGFSTERFVDETMEMFAEMLADRLAGPVNDATGLKGKYDFELRWIQDGGVPREDSPGVTLLQAIQEQLGLKVQKTKSMVDIFVVDHLEKTPTEN